MQGEGFCEGRVHLSPLAGLLILLQVNGILRIMLYRLAVVYILQFLNNQHNIALIRRILKKAKQIR